MDFLMMERTLLAAQAGNPPRSLRSLCSMSSSNLSSNSNLSSMHFSMALLLLLESMTILLN